MTGCVALALLALSSTHHHDRAATQQRQLEESLDEDHYVEHRFKQKVSKALASALEVNAVLTSLSLAGDPHNDFSGIGPVGAKAIAELVTKLVAAGLQQGDAGTKAHLERYCGHVQAKFFDGVHFDEWLDVLIGSV